MARSSWNGWRPCRSIRNSAADICSNAAVSGTHRGDATGALAARARAGHCDRRRRAGTGGRPLTASGPAGPRGRTAPAPTGGEHSLRRACEERLPTDLAAAFAAHDADGARRLIGGCLNGRCANEAAVAAWRSFSSNRVAFNRRKRFFWRAAPTATHRPPARRLACSSNSGISGVCYQAAARMLAEIGTRFADLSVTPQQCGSEWLAAYPRDSLTFEAYRRLASPPWTGGGVRIVENRVANDALQAIYNGNGIQCHPTPHQSPFDLFDKGRGGAGAFCIVDRHSGQEHPETINVPSRFFYPVSTQSGYVQHSHVGHFFPLGGTGALHGISLLERKLLWTTIPKGLANLNDVVRVGPAGPTFCTFQYRQHLFAVDPVDGRLLWHRDDLEAASGLMNEPFLGIIGDERVLAVFASNGANYTLYDTASGAELRRGKLDIQVARLPPRAIGRRLFHYTAASESRRLRVWDPLTDRFAWDEPADQIAEASALEGVPPGTKILTFVRDTEEAAFVTNDGRIRVVDLVTGADPFRRRARTAATGQPEFRPRLSRPGAVLLQPAALVAARQVALDTRLSHQRRVAPLRPHPGGSVRGRRQDAANPLAPDARQPVAPRHARSAASRPRQPVPRPQAGSVVVVGRSLRRSDRRNAGQPRRNSLRPALAGLVRSAERADRVARG